MQSAINTAIDTSIDSIVALFTTNLPLIFVVVASLIGLGLVFKLLQEFIGYKSWQNQSWGYAQKNVDSIGFSEYRKNRKSYADSPISWD